MSGGSAGLCKKGITGEGATHGRDAWATFLIQNEHGRCMICEYVGKLFEKSGPMYV